MEQQLLEHMNRAYAVLVFISIVGGSVTQRAIGFTDLVEVIAYMISIVAFGIGAALEVYVGYKTPIAQLIAACLGFICIGCIKSFMEVFFGL